MKPSPGCPAALCGWYGLPRHSLVAGDLWGRICESVDLRGICRPLTGIVSGLGLALGSALLYGGGRALFGSVGRLLAGSLPLLGVSVASHFGCCFGSWVALPSVGSDSPSVQDRSFGAFFLC